MRFVPLTFFLLLLGNVCWPEWALVRGDLVRAETLSLDDANSSRDVARLDNSTNAANIELAKLPAGQRLEIHTEARVYRLTLIDPKTCETNACVSLDGRQFSQAAKVYLLGATHGRQSSGGEMLVLMGQVKSGLRIEMGLGSLSRFDRALSEPVTHVRLLAVQTR